ncbi:hypothetical protein [Nonomuraea longicatena]|uniref:hypothetical protein n=1 Tax=Nonomuraea longicatena TaxID=83682 RepID=UPI0031DA4636
MLDNAADDEQVLPLLPPDPCQALITSRNRLDTAVALHGVRRLPVQVMTREEARELLLAVTGEAPEELIERCDRLPLALRLAAAQLELSEPPPASIDALDAGIAPFHTLRSTFDASYDRLAPEARMLFRTLGGLPCADFSRDNLAAATGLSPAETGPHLRAMLAGHLIVAAGRHRFTLHDLVKRYAAERHAEEDPDSGVYDRLADWYQRRARSAAALAIPQFLYLPAPDDPGDAFTSEEQALAWLEAEYANLLTFVENDRSAGRVRWMIVDALRGYWHLRLQFADRARLSEIGLAAARAAGDDRALAMLYSSLSEDARLRGDHRTALERAGAALEHARASRWSPYEAAALGTLGTLLLTHGRARSAADCYLQAIDVHRRVGSLRGVISNTGNLGLANFCLGAFGHAAQQLGEALRLERERNSTVGEAMALGNLGEVSLHRGELVTALEQLVRAWRIWEEMGNIHGVVAVLSVMSGVHTGLGRSGTARALAARAHDLAVVLNDNRMVADADNALAAALRRDSPEAALRLHQRALFLSRDNRHAWTRTQIGIAESLLLLGERGPARSHAEWALAEARSAGYRYLEGQALLTAGRPDTAARVLHGTAPVVRRL